jgi:hypothetical protein
MISGLNYILYYIYIIRQICLKVGHKIQLHKNLICLIFVSNSFIPNTKYVLRVLSTFYNALENT